MPTSAEIEQFLVSQRDRMSSLEAVFLLRRQMADALERVYPFNDYTGNMRRGLLMQGPPMRESWGWSAGVGSLIILREMEQEAPYKPIAEFLNWYRKWLDSMKAVRLQKERATREEREALMPHTLRAQFINRQIKRSREYARKIRSESIAAAGFRSPAHVEHRMEVLESKIATIRRSWRGIEEAWRAHGMPSGRTASQEIRHMRGLRRKHMGGIAKHQHEIDRLLLVDEPSDYVDIIERMIPQLKAEREHFRQLARPRRSELRMFFVEQWTSGWHGTFNARKKK